MYKEISIPYFLKYLSELPAKSFLKIYYDIETFSTNLGAEKPSFFKSHVWSLAISYYDFYSGDLKVCLFPDFKPFLDCFKKSMSSGKVELIAHNGNRYDHHFLRYALIHDYGLVPHTGFSKNSIEHEHEIKRKQFQGRKFLIEKRIKSKTMLELNFAINKKYVFETCDSLPKTNLPLRKLGEKCLHGGLIGEDEIKTEMDYESYNFESEKDNAKAIGLKYFNQMSAKEREYIINDVVILAVASKHYSELYPHFDFEKRTMSLNVLEQYTEENRLALFQMIGKYGEDFRDKVDYLDFKWNENESLYTYLRKFYKGGLNFYNDRYLEKNINRRIFSIDLNSSYPNVMYHETFPTFLKTVQKNGIYKHEPDSKATLYLLEISKATMNEFLENINSLTIRKMFVKYYANIFSDSVYVTNITIDMMNQFSKIKIRTIPVIACLAFECERFAGHEKIFEYYKIKSQGKSKKIMTWKSPTDYEVTQLDNPYPLTQAEIDLAKLMLNSVYGIPALRKFFNIFKYKDGELTNFRSGHENSSRNLMFAITTTSYSLKNLLEPLTHLNYADIDRYFYYCDTDSLYLDYACYEKLSKKVFLDKVALGAWDIEHDNIQSFWIQNHKKYCFLEDGKVTIKSGGIDTSAFDIFEKFPTAYKPVEKKVKRTFSIEAFETFCHSKFCTGTKIYNNSAVLNNDEVITIYKRETELSKAFKYPDEFDNLLDNEVKTIIEELNGIIDEDKESFLDDSNSADDKATNVSDEGVFIETPVQNFGMEDIERANLIEDCSDKYMVEELITKHERIKEEFYWDRVIEDKK